MTKITLPPLPEHLHHPELQKLDAFTREQLRARDLEVARLVLDSAAQAIRGRGAGSWDFYQIIRAITIEEN